MTAAPLDFSANRCVDDLLDAWHAGRRDIRPFLAIQTLLDRIRAVPVGDKRLNLMTSVVRSLGRPQALAAFLDMLRWAALSRHPNEDEYMSMLQNVRMHSIYGWCGNTMLVESGREAVASTYPVLPGLAEKLGQPCFVLEPYARRRSRIPALEASLSWRASQPRRLPSRRTATHSTSSRAW